MNLYADIPGILSVKIHKTARSKGVFIAAADHHRNHQNLEDLIRRNEDVTFHVFVESSGQIAEIYKRDNVTVIQCDWKSPAFRNTISKHLLLFDFVERKLPLVVFNSLHGFNRKSVDLLLQKSKFVASWDFCDKRNYACGYTSFIMNPCYLSGIQLPNFVFLEFCKRIIARMERKEESVLMNCFIVPNVLSSNVLGVTFDYSSFEKMDDYALKNRVSIKWADKAQFSFNRSLIDSALVLLNNPLFLGYDVFPECTKLLKRLDLKSKPFFEYAPQLAKPEEVFVFLLGKNKDMSKFFADKGYAVEEVYSSWGRDINEAYNKSRKIGSRKYLIFWDAKVGNPDCIARMHTDALPAQLSSKFSALGPGVTAITRAQFEKVNGFANNIKYLETLHERVAGNQIPAYIDQHSGTKRAFLKEQLLSYSRHYPQDGLRAVVPVRMPDPKILIVIPFGARFLGGMAANSERLAQLKEYRVCMKKMLRKNTVVVIAEQIKHQKMNAGWCRNVGIKWHVEDSGREYGKVGDILITNDVDMLPDIKMFASFWFVKDPISMVPPDDGVYTGKIPVGGAISGMKYSDFKEANGYPNTFWGWGGEDTALDARLKRLGKKIRAGNEGRIRHTDTMRISQKKDEHLVATGKVVKNVDRRLQEDKNMWRSDGYAQTKFNIEKVTRSGQIIHIIFS